MSVERRPEWHASAPCRGDERWLTAERHSRQSMEVLRSVCRACPLSGRCLEEAMGLPADVRAYGVLRVGTRGQTAWRHVDSFVAEFAPVTEEEWAIAAAWIVDGDVDELEVVRVRRQWRQNRPTSLPRRVEVKAGGFPSLRHYNPPSPRALTSAEILAARSA